MSPPDPRPEGRGDASRPPAEPLSAEHEALLRVVLVHGRTYAAVAAFLGLSEEEVRRDVHRAIELRFGVSTTGREEHGQILDRLLGQRDASSDVIVGRILATDAGQRLWAESVARSLGRPVLRAAAGTLHAGDRDDDATLVLAPRSPPRARPDPAMTECGVPPSTALDRHPKPWWRTGSAVVAAALLAGFLLFGAGIVAVSRSGSAVPAPAAPAPSAVPATTAASAAPKADATTGAAATSDGYKAFALADPDGPANGTIAARASVSDYRGRPSIAISGTGAQPNKNNVYALWLQRPSRRNVRLGDLPKVGADGRLAGAAAVPNGIPATGSVLVTLDAATGARATPGQLVLSGPLPVG